jgi:hypothetical protein
MAGKDRKKKEDPPVNGAALLFHKLEDYVLPASLSELDPGGFVYSGIRLPTVEFCGMCDVVGMFSVQTFAGRGQLVHGDVVKLVPDGGREVSFIILHPEGDGNIVGLAEGRSGLDLLPTHGGYYYARLPDGVDVDSEK